MKQRCECAVLNIETFYKYFYGVVKNEQITHRIKFFQQIPLFQRLSENELCQLIFQSNIVHCNRGQVIYTQGDIADSLYVIKAGEFQVFKNVTIDKRDEIKQQMDEAKQGLLMKNRNLISKRINVCNLTEGHVFGADELFTSTPRQTSVVAYQILSSVFLIQYDKSKQILGKIIERDYGSNALSKFIN